MALSSLPLVWWLFIERKSYVRFDFAGFRVDGKVVGHIANVGVPTTLMQGAMAIQMLLITMILAAIGHDRSVAVFNSGWKVVSIALLPLIGTGTAVTSVAAASFGAREYGKLRVIQGFSLKIGLVLELAIALLTALGAPALAFVFSWGETTKDLGPDIAAFLRVIWIFYPATAAGLISSSLFQGVRKGFYSLVLTILRTIVFAVPLSYLMGIVLGWGEMGVYAGIIAAAWLSSAVAFVWSNLYLKKLCAPRPREAEAAGAQPAVPAENAAASDAAED